MTERSTGNRVTLYNELSNQLKYNVDSFKFDAIELVDKESPKILEFSLGIAGVGLPESDYMKIAKKLYEINSKIICPSTYGAACHTDGYCNALYPSISDLSFDFKFGDKNDFTMPLLAFLR